jgi:OH-DDVA meta-cleavage compound hydrolase
VSSSVLDDFPALKILVSHGGGAIPYQLGRFESASLRGKQRFSTKLRKLYFDTVLYTPAALRLLIETIGPEHCLFGTECPGVGSAINPETGETMDDIAPYIERFDWLSAADKRAIFEDNVRKLFKL